MATNFLTTVAIALALSACAKQPASVSTQQPSPEPKPTRTPMTLAQKFGYIEQASISCRDFPSSRDANAALNDMLPHRGESDPKVVKRGAKLDATGKQVGRRVVTWSCCGVEGQSAAHVLWTDGSKFCDVIAATVKEALDFERKQNP